MNQVIRYVVFLFFFLSFFLFFSEFPAHGFIVKGLQPIQPHGGFSGFSASTSGRGVFSAGVDLEKSINIDYYRATAKAGYGITEGTDLLLTVPYNFEWDEDHEGYEDINIGIKQNFFRENKYGPSIAYLLKVALGSGKRQFSSDGSAGAGLIISKKIGPFSSHLNFIYSVPFDDDLEEQIEVIISFALRASHDADIVSEFHAVNSYFHDTFESIEGRLGYRLKTADNIYTVLGAGHDFKNSDPEFRLMVSFNFIFGGQGSANNSL